MSHEDTKLKQYRAEVLNHDSKLIAILQLNAYNEYHAMEQAEEDYIGRFEDIGAIWIEER